MYLYVPVKHPYRGNVRWAFFEWADIPDATDPDRTYLRRLRIFQTPWFAFYLHWIYLHWIYLPDEDRDPHDHPCNFWSLVVRGGYTERVYQHREELQTNSEHRRRRWSFHRMPVHFAHIITSLRPGTVTLCLFGRRQRGWGFWTENGFVPYEVYDRA